MRTHVGEPNAELDSTHRVLTGARLAPRKRVGPLVLLSNTKYTNTVIRTSSAHPASWRCEVWVWRHSSRQKSQQIFFYISTLMIKLAHKRVVHRRVDKLYSDTTVYMWV